MAESLIAQLAGSGVLGVVLVIVMLALRQKDQDNKELQALVQSESKARVDDAQRMLGLAMTLQKESTLAITALTAVMEELKEQRELLTREILRTTPGAVRR